MKRPYWLYVSLFESFARESDVHRARIEYYETVGMLRGLHYGGAIDSWQLLALTELAGSAYINAGKPW